jgi:hypothetical protein
MARYVSRPGVPVEALQYLGAPFPSDNFARATLRRLPQGGVEIRTWDGPRACQFGDWVLCDGDGSFSVMRKPAFETLFELAREKRAYNRREVNAEA